MDNLDYFTIGQRIRTLRKYKRMNQSELAKQMGKSLRTIQKYESGEIEVSLLIVNQLAKLLDTTPTFILGYPSCARPVQSLADIAEMFFQIEKISGLKFDIDVKKPPQSEGWQCSIVFNGKEGATHNADMCLFLESWNEEREKVRSYDHTPKSYRKWQDETLTYYAGSPVEQVEMEELSSRKRREKRNAYLKEIQGENSEGK